MGYAGVWGHLALILKELGERKHRAKADAAPSGCGARQWAPHKRLIDCRAQADESGTRRPGPLLLLTIRNLDF